VVLCRPGIRQQQTTGYQTFQIPETAETRIKPKWLFPRNFSDRFRPTSGCLPMKQKTTMEGGGFFGVAEGSCSLLVVQGGALSPWN